MIKVLELFGGIGACTQALKNLGIEFQIADYVEIDKYAVASYNAMNGTDFQPQDITKWDKNIAVDLIMHGSPCQDFSLAGKEAGGDEGSGTRSSLMYETIRIVKKTMPQYVIWENVKNLLSKKHKHNFDNYIKAMDKAGYNSYYKVINSKDYGIPQNRERVFTISIRKQYDKGYTFPEKEELKLKLKDMLEENVDEKYFLSDKMKQYISKQRTANYRNNDCTINLDIARPITTDQNKRAGTTNYLSEELPENYNLIKIKNLTKKGYLEAEEGDGIDISTRMEYHRGTVQKGIVQTLDCKGGEGHGVVVKPKEKLRIRKLTPKECWRLMGFPDQAYERAEKFNSNAQLYKQAGNSIVVNVLEKILKNLIGDKMEKKEPKIIEYVGKTYDLTNFYWDYKEPAQMMKAMGDKMKEIIDVINKLARPRIILQSENYNKDFKIDGIDYVKPEQLTATKIGSVTEKMINIPIEIETPISIIDKYTEEHEKNESALEYIRNLDSLDQEQLYQLEEILEGKHIPRID